MKKWNKQKILSKIKSLQKKEIPLNSTYINKHYGSLYGAAFSYFGSWQKAVQACGYDYSRIRKVQSWTKDNIKSKIRNLHNKREDLSHTNIKKKHPKLFEASIRYFGSWKNTVESSGIEYDKFLRVKKHSKSDIINEYRKIRKKFEYAPMPKDLKGTGDGWIVTQVNKKFGSFEKFFNDLGIEYKGRRYWTKEKLVKEYRSLVNNLGYVPSINEVRSRYKKGDLLRQIYKRYGNYYTFLNEVGFKPKKKNKGFWTKEKIKEEYFKISRELNYFPSYSDLRKLGYNDITIAIQRVFDGAENFYNSSGVKPKKRRTVSWTKKKIIAEFKRVADEFGRSPTEHELRSIDRNDLALAVKRYFGSYKEIQKITGLRPKTKPPKWPLSNIKREYTKITNDLGFPPTCGQLHEMKKSGLSAAISQSIGFSKLLKEMGYKPRRKDKYWNEEKVKQEYLKEMEKRDYPPTMSELKASRSDLFSQISRRFGGIIKLAEELNIKVSQSYYDPLWQPWEKFVIDVCKKLFGGTPHKRLLNGGIPDFITKKKIIIDAKLSYYPLINKDIVKYSPFTKRIEFWIASKYVPKSSDKVKYLGINEIEQLLRKNGLTELISKLILFGKRIDPSTQEVLIKN